MATTIYDLKSDEEAQVIEAIRTDDYVTLFMIANHHAKYDNLEYAHELQKMARKAERNTWAYDEAVDNNLQDQYEN